MDELYYRHFVLTRADGCILDGWSNGVKPERDTSEAVCIRENGGYQFEIMPDMQSIPLCTPEEIPLYKWDGTQVVLRTEEELAADHAAVSPFSSAST